MINYQGTARRIKPHNLSEDAPTKNQLLREVRRLKRLYRKRRGSRPGRIPQDQTFYVLAAWLMFGNSPWKTIMKFLETNFKGMFDNYEHKNLYRSKAYKDIISENSWDYLRMGQKVYRKIKNEGPISPRKIEQDLKILRAKLKRLPMPGIVIQTTHKNPKGVSLRMPRKEEVLQIIKSQSGSLAS